jgi:hypothetical protein
VATNAPSLVNQHGPTLTLYGFIGGRILRVKTAFSLIIVAHELQLSTLMTLEAFESTE